jgi:hypothetical protein
MDGQLLENTGSNPEALVVESKIFYHYYLKQLDSVAK